MILRVVNTPQKDGTQLKMLGKISLIYSRYEYTVTEAKLRRFSAHGHLQDRIRTCYILISPTHFTDHPEKDGIKKTNKIHLA